MNNNTELILIRITGLDRPGLTASITEILSKYDVTILDIGQADIHSTLSLGILFKSQEKDSGNIMKELLFKASALGIASSRGDWASVITVTADRESRPKKSPSSQRSACWGRRLPCRSCWRAAAAESLPAVTAAAHRVSAASSRDRNRRIWICFIGITSQTSLCGEGGKDAGEKNNFFQKSY